MEEKTTARDALHELELKCIEMERRMLECSDEKLKIAITEVRNQYESCYSEIKGLAVEKGYMAPVKAAKQEQITEAREFIQNEQ